MPNVSMTQEQELLISPPQIILPLPPAHNNKAIVRTCKLQHSEITNKQTDRKLNVLSCVAANNYWQNMEDIRANKKILLEQQRYSIPSSSNPSSYSCRG